MAVNLEKEVWWGRKETAQPGEADWTVAAANTGLGTQFGGNAVEGRRRVRADCRNGAQTHDDDQGQHDGVFDCGRAIFRNNETLHALDDVHHGGNLSLECPACTPGNAVVSFERSMLCETFAEHPSETLNPYPTP